MSKQYIVDETELLDLLENYYKMTVLERDGVDNWSWYMEGKKDFLKCAIKQNPKYQECNNEQIEDMIYEGYGFQSLAEDELENYEVYKESSC